MNNNIEFFNKLKAEILGKCHRCNHEGIVESSKCDCLLSFERYVKLFYRGIKKEYWDLTLDNWKKDSLTKTEIQKYIAKLEKAKDLGSGLILLGENGLGKTMMLSIILKAAFDKNYNILLIDSWTLYDEIMNIPPFVENIFSMDVDFLGITDLGNEIHLEKFNTYRSRLELTLGKRKVNCLPTLVSTNLGDIDIKEQYGKIFFDILNEKNKKILFHGKGLNKQIDEMLSI